MLRVRLSLCFLALLASSAMSTSLRAQATPKAAPSINAEDLDVDLSTGAVVYRGNAVVTFDDVRLTADEMIWQRGTNTVIARGNAVAQQADRRLIAKEITYHIDTRLYSVTDLRFGQAPIYVSGEAVEGAPDRLIFRQATVSYGEPGDWAPTLTADSLTLFTERNRLQAVGGRLGLGFFRPLPLPNTPLPTDIPLVDDITFNGGFTSRLGAHLLVGAKVPVSSTLSAGADIGLFTKRGIMFGPSLRYQTTDESGLGATGELSSGYIHDSGSRLTDILGDPVPADRSMINWQHRQTLAPNFTFNAELHAWSDSEVLRDFRARDFFPVQVPDSFAELTYTSANTVTGLFLRAQPNPFHQVRERLPELTFDLLPTPVAAGWIHEAHSSIALLRDDPPAGGPGLRSDRFDAYYALTRPWSPESWLSVNPMVGARLTHYNRALGGKGDYTRALGEIGFDAQMRASAVFDYENERWGIHGLRHLVTPQLSYRYVPEADKGTAYIPAVDRRVFATYLDPLGLGDRRQIDQLGSMHTLRLALDQRLQTRDEVYGSRDLVHLNLALDSRFDTAPGERTLSALHSELHLTPAPFIDFALYHRVTPGDWKMRELNTAITLRSANKWSVQFANHFLEGEIQEYIAGLAYRVNEVWEGYTRHHFDSRRDRFVEQRYGVRQTIANRWIVGYELAFFEGPRRESNFGFNLVLDAVKF